MATDTSITRLFTGRGRGPARLVSDGDRWYVEWVDTLWGDPIAVCQWWPVLRIRGVMSGPPVHVEHGDEVQPLPTSHPGGEYAGRGFAVDLLNGSKTLPARRWHAEIPPPKGCEVREGTRFLEQGQCAYWNGVWHKGLARSVKALPLPKRLRWVEK